MFENIIKFYRLGKELGLTKKEINNLLLFKNYQHSRLYMFLFVFLMIIIITLSTIIIGFSIIQLNRNTYPAGTRYSTVKIKDFRIKNDKKFQQ